LVLVLQSPTQASANLCYVTGSTDQVDHHSGGASGLTGSVPTSNKNDTTELVFSNAIVNPVTVLCPLDIHPGLPLEGAQVNVVRLRDHSSDNYRRSDSEDSSRGFSCALMSRSAAGGQASGRRVSRIDGGRIDLPGLDGDSSSDNDDHSHYRFIECELPAYSAIVSYSAMIKTDDTSTTDVHRLIDALMRKPLPGTASDEKATAGISATRSDERQPANLPSRLRRDETPR